MTVMKRLREDDREVEVQAMANCLMLLSRFNDNASSNHNRNEFECKTCKKRFASFQALGGHRASHKRPRLLAGAGEFLAQGCTVAKKPKMHKCSICSLEFSMGQALGGHMRRHRAAADEGLLRRDESPAVVAGRKMIPVLRKSNSSKRIFCLDLNLSPDENVDDDLKLWPTTAPALSPVLRCFI